MNPFARLPPYQYSQLTFKSFSEEEMKNQAGGSSLPAAEVTRADKVELLEGLYPASMVR